VDKEKTPFNKEDFRMNRLSKPEDQPDFIKGYNAFLDGKAKDKNPYQNWMRKGAGMKTIYWNMGWEKAEKDAALLVLNPKLDIF
jgi:ribosome modulation factor